jgi:hypothetical protein
LRRYVLILIAVSALGFAGPALAQTTAPEATVPPVPTPAVEATTPPQTEPPPAVTAPPAEAPAVPGTTTDDADDGEGGLSSNTILFLILGGVVLVLIAFGVAMSQRRPGDPDARV